MLPASRNLEVVSRSAENDTQWVDAELDRVLRTCGIGDRVLAVAGVEDIGVVAGAADQNVGIGRARQRVVTGPAVDRRDVEQRHSAHVDRVVATRARDHVRATDAVDDLDTVRRRELVEPERVVTVSALRRVRARAAVEQVVFQLDYLPVLATYLTMAAIAAALLIHDWRTNGKLGYTSKIGAAYVFGQQLLHVPISSSSAFSELTLFLSSLMYYR